MAERGLVSKLYFEVADSTGEPGTGPRFLPITGGDPGGDTGIEDASAIGTLATRTDTGQVYKKIANAGALADWDELTSTVAVVSTWRTELVRAATNDTLAIGNTDPTTWTDNDGGLDHTAFTIGEFVYADFDGSAALFEVTGISAPNITLAAATPALSDGDTFVVRNHLPDPAGQEDQAIVLFSTGGSVKLSDVNWEIADAIFLTAGYTAVNGNIAASESVNSAIEKLDGNQQDIQTASGLTQGDTNYGSWTSPVDLLFSATATAKALFQRVGDLLMQLRGVEVTGITAQTEVDSVPIATVQACKWLVEAFEEATPTKRRAMEIYALNAGSGTDVDHNEDKILKVPSTGASFNLIMNVDISGGNMRLLATSSSAGVTVTARRIEVVKTLL